MSFEFYNPFLANLLHLFSPFSVTEKENELLQANEYGAKLDTVNCGPSDGNNEKLATMSLGELRDLIHAGLAERDDVVIIAQWINLANVSDRVLIRTMLKHLGLHCHVKPIRTSQLREESSYSNVGRTMGYFYKASENQPQPQHNLEPPDPKVKYLALRPRAQ